MTEPEPRPDLAPAEQSELARHADVPLVPAARQSDHDGPVEPRPPIVDGLRLWWLPALGLIVGFAFIATDHMWRAGASLAGSLWLAAALRAVYSQERAGGLVVRSKWLDVTMLVIAGALVALSAFTLDLRDLRG